MKCRIDSHNKENSKGLIVRRKFVPIKFKITGESQFVNAGAKLPFTTNKVLGIFTTSTIKKQCSDDLFPSHLYYGVSDSKVIDTSFLKTNRGEIYNSNYPYDVQIRQETTAETWWYYAHPVTDQFPWIFENDFADRLQNPSLIHIKQPGQCNPEKYYLWSEPLVGYARITYNFKD